jgi:hypothetical protein
LSDEGELRSTGAGHNGVVVDPAIHWSDAKAIGRRTHPTITTIKVKDHGAATVRLAILVSILTCI